ncbi:MAG: sigma 54-interacting transcriptional regulator [Acidobacteria bacterium]|nr:sigma 54-interacting transcriptional regulator [Acidobacteriota bacterium]
MLNQVGRYWGAECLNPHSSFGNTTSARQEGKIGNEVHTPDMPHFGPMGGTEGEAERDRTLLEVNNALITSLTQNSLLTAVSKALHRAVDFDAVALILHLPERDTFRILALEGIVRHFRVGQEIGRKDTSVGWVFDHQHYILRRNLAAEAEYENERRLLDEGMHSHCVVPLIVRGKSIGTLNLASKNSHQYSEDDAAFLEAIAVQVALAVQNMKAYEEIASLNAQVSRTAEQTRTLLEINNAIVTKLNKDELLHAICEAMKRAVPFDEVGLMLHEPETDTLRVVSIESPLPSEFFKVGRKLSRDGPAGQAFDQRRAVLRKNLEHEAENETERRVLADGVLSVCGLPLIVHDQCLGALSVASVTANQYSQEDATFLKEVANQVAIAIANMKSHEEIASLNTKITRAAERSRTLLEINNAIITSLSQDALLRSISKVLRGVIRFDRCAFTLYQPEKENFRFVSMDSEIESEYFRAGLEFDPKNSIAGLVYRDQKAALRHDLEKEQQYLNDRRLVAEGIKSYCVVPMVTRAKCIGTLNVGSRAKNQYSEQDADFLQEVATQVALAVENMQAYEEINALKTRIEAENVYLQEEILQQHNFDEIVGNSPALLELLHKLEIIAPTDASVLLYGETGTGKELLARAIHSRSPRSARAMVTVNCGAIPSGLVESELFGHVKGAFTGALKNAIGRFELANGSTLFLDEVGELPADTQVKLLRVLQEHEFQPVGSSRSQKVDVRTIAATNRNLEDDVRAGRFRADLFYRLNVLPLRVPPLRERRADIPELGLFFVERSCKKFGRKIMSISKETMEHLMAYDWPGNIRELQNVIERGVVLCRGSVLSMGRDLLPIANTPIATANRPLAGDSVEPNEQLDPRNPADPQRSLESVEKEHILRVLDSTGGIIEGPKGAAQILALHPSTLRARMKKLQIHRPAH